MNWYSDHFHSVKYVNAKIKYIECEQCTKTQFFYLKWAAQRLSSYLIDLLCVERLFAAWELLHIHQVGIGELWNSNLIMAIRADSSGYMICIFQKEVKIHDSVTSTFNSVGAKFWHSFIWLYIRSSWHLVRYVVLMKKLLKIIWFDNISLAEN